MSTRFTDPKGRPSWMQTMERCKHFNGVQHATCEAGVVYEDVKDRTVSPYRLPCWSNERSTTACPRAVFPTEAEAKAHEQQIAERFEAYARDLAEGRCPICHRAVTKRQVGRCVYGDPCGHRLYQGRA